MTKATKPATRGKVAKAAKRVITRLARISADTAAETKNKRKAVQANPLEAVEQLEQEARIQRAEDTRKRNASAQNAPGGLKKLKRGDDRNRQQSDEDADVHAFFESIDDTFLRICGSCDELSKSARMIKKRYDPSNQYFSALKNENGVCELIAEAITQQDSSGMCFTWICSRCNTSLTKNEMPKFCRASGFRIGPLPRELAVLNRTEARLVGLGISFTTCFNLYRDQQEFTRGNAVNYWNDVREVVLSLPRPLSKCGVVLLRSKSNQGTSLIKVRPDVVRSALEWLIANNPLYRNVTISEENLEELARASIDDTVSSITLTEEEATELHRSCPASAGVSDMLDETGKSSSKATRNNSCLSSIPNTVQQHHSCEVLEIEESFELEADQSDELTEAEKNGEIVNKTTGKTIYPTGELRDMKNPINEYTTKMLMQNCFPTLFPNGEGGLHGLVDADGKEYEQRSHEYHVAECCAHVMKWHDRRFVTHCNFKFFCLNLIQRRQIDGLVRRIGSPHHEANTDGSTPVQGCTEGVKNDISAAMKMLDSLKPYFCGVRGSGLYWSNVRDDLMSMLGSRVLPSRWPTFFLTLSAADTVWPDFFRACNPKLTLQQARELNNRERRRYLIENPDIAARHFHRRFDAFFTTVLCGNAKPLGEVSDYFWRVEFQQRGSPHIHALLWIKDAPDVLQLSETELGRAQLASYVDNVISVLSKSSNDLKSWTCSTCTTEESTNLDILSARPPNTRTCEWDCDLSRVVQRVQQHICSSGSL